MEFAVEELDNLKRKLNITVPEDEVCSRVNNAYKILNRQITMPGFRKGKIPQKILEKQVPIQSLKDMFQEMMQEYYDKALKESGIIPAGAPEIENTELENIKKDAPFKFSVVLDIKPTLEVKDYKGLKYKMKEARVSEEELEKAINDILVRYGNLEHYEDEEHKIQKGDFLLLDFEGFMEGQPLEDGAATDYKVRVGDKRMIEGFEDQLVEHKVGEEFEIKVALPANWNNKIQRISMPVPGTEGESHDDRATFKVKIKEVRYQVLPELNDEIAEKEGFSNVDLFRRGVKTDLQAYKEQQEEIRIKEDIFNKLVKENKVEPPETMVKRELRFMIEGMKYQIEQSGMKLEDSGFEQEKAEEEWRDKAIFNTKGYLVLEAIAARENIHVAQTDLDEEYKKLAEQTKQRVEDIKRRMMANAESLNQTTSKILGLKTMDFVYSNCEFEYVKELDAEETAKTP
ncbi:MAG: trigger factor [Nitrospinae bacterium]|nr:trigger factor [Nitrospinota bacterium]MDA1110778.1 trigger factor [Nitrospinota bacterium]